MNRQLEVQEKAWFSNWQVAKEADVSDLLAFGKSHGWFFQVMDEKGVLKGEIIKSDWVYQPDCITDPVTSGKEEAYKRLKAVLDAGYPVKQVIYGYQVRESKDEPEAQPAPIATPPNRSSKSPSGRLH